MAATVESAFASVPAGVWVFVGGLVSVAFGNVLTKWLARQAENRNDRKDYREEIREVWERMDSLEEQVTLWRERYYAEQAVSASLRVLLIRNGIDPNLAAPIVIQAPPEPPSGESDAPGS